MNIHSSTENVQFYGRRKGRRLSKFSQLAIKDGKDYFIKEEYLSNIFHHENYVVLEIGFGDGENLINSAKINPKLFYIGADPFLNATAKCLNKLLLFNLKNVLIWPDDIRNILNDFPYNSISEIKLLFPDPWPKTKHHRRRLIQNTLIEKIYQILKPNGSITIATDHDVLKNWVLEKFQRYKEFEWIAKSSKDWQSRPSDCFKTKYETKSILQKRKPSWFIFKKK